MMLITKPAAFPPFLKSFFTYSINNWITTTIGPHLQEFDLALFTDGFNLHLNLLTCSNLVFLRQGVS
ncbi:unnamed protein product [Trifolium pratense]|uniref:Uncharacterized protein n=1 Tax=Trifolium pratense TaxID=57577 RepID=A0ACB0IWU0_TRIPR|nr:unnamed protein product [Trifolium pratense]